MPYRKIITVMAALVGTVGGCQSSHLDVRCVRPWVLHGHGEHERVLDISSETGPDDPGTPGNCDVHLFLRGDSLRQLGRYDEASAALSRATDDGRIFWVDREFVGLLPIEPQLRLCKALVMARDPNAFPQTQAEHIELMFRYYGSRRAFADEVAKACATAYMSKEDAIGCASDM